MVARARKPDPPEKFPALRCQVKMCPITFGSGEVTSAVIWSARLKNWGIVEGIVLCPEHAGRIRTRLVAPHVLEGQEGMFDLPPDAVVVKRKKNNRVIS